MKTTKHLAIILCSFAFCANVSQAQSELDRSALPIPEPTPETIATLDARDAKAPPRTR